MLYPIRRTLHQAIIKLMLLSLSSSILAGLIPPPLVRSVAPPLADRLPQPAVALAAGTISGTVFQDFNSNGAKDSATVADPRTDGGVAGVTVTVYDSAGAAQGNDVTDATGAYSIAATGTGPYRVEFTTLPTGYYPTTHNSNSGSNTTAPNSTATTAGTTVQFVPDGNSSNVNLGINYPSEYCQSNPLLCTARLDSGSGVGNTGQGFVSFPYNVSGAQLQYGGTAANMYADATVDQVGTVWGVAYQSSQRRLFTAAYLKRHIAFADGPGYVYVLDYSTTPASVAGSFNLQGITPLNGGAAIDLGAVTRANVAGAISAGAAGDNQIPASTSAPSRDLDAFAKVGKMSFGDIDLSEDKRTLWLVNLYQQALIAVDVSGATGSLPGGVNQYLLSGLTGAPTCTNGSFRPWGLKFYKGKGYVGGVCDGATGSRTNLRAYVLSFAPTNIAAGLTTEIQFALPQSRIAGDGGAASWRPWISTYAETANPADDFAIFQASLPTGNYGIYPQPILSDIEFQADGAMILGFRDRLGDQLGQNNYKALSGNTALESLFSWGDMLKACKVGAAYVIEGSAGCPVNYSGTFGVSGNGEYFYDEMGDAGQEGASGGLALLPGTNEVATTIVDPKPVNVTGYSAAHINSQGLHWNNLINGAQTDWYQITPEQFPAGTPINSLAKANGLGDLEILCDAAPVEIGNRVWLDSDGDGLQDPNEAPISGVTVELYKNGVKVGQATTDANGEYYFTSGTSATDANTSDNIIHDSGIGILPGTGTSGGNSLYEIRIPNVSGGSKQAALGTNTLTTANAGSNDSIDSDGSVSGVNASYTIPYADLASSGYNNHTYDFGFGPAPTTGTIQIVKNTSGGNGSFGYSSSNATLDTVHLTTVGGTASSSVMTLSAGSYPLSEDALVGWSLTNLACTGDSDGGNVVALANRQVTIDLDAGESQLCTFSNTAQSSSITPSGVLTLTKTVVGTGSGPFNITVNGSNGYNNATTVSPGTPIVLSSLASGVYTVTETSPGAGWTTSYTVTSGTGTANSNNAVVTLSNAAPNAGANPAFATTGTLSGSVFRDFNASGTRTASVEPGVGGISVSATCVSNAGADGVVGTRDDVYAAAVTTTTAANGAYTLTNLPHSQCQVTFSLPTGLGYLQPGAAGGTSVQFVNLTGGTATADWGVNNPADYSNASTTPDLASQVWWTQFGDPSQALPNNPSLYRFPYGISGYVQGTALGRPGEVNGPHTLLTNFNQLGVTWGLAYQRSTNTLFLTALVRRGASLPYGPDAIFKVNASTGAVTRLATTVDTDAGAVPADSARNTRDTTVYGQVGTLGWGDLDMLADDQTLVGVNLRTKTLEFMNATSGASLASVTIPSPTCTGGVFRPWALAVHDGLVYTGGVCDGSSGTRANLTAHVYAYNPGTVAVRQPGDSGTATVAAGGWTGDVLGASRLDYAKGCIGKNTDFLGPTGPIGCGFEIWISNAATWATDMIWSSNNNGIAHPSPLLSDLVFDNDGSLVVGFLDRSALQNTTWRVDGPGTNDGYLAHASGGDILRFSPPTTTGGIFVREAAGVVARGASLGGGTLTGFGTAGGANVSGSGEFYDDNFEDDLIPSYTHPETSLGSLTLVPGRSDVVLSAFDPRNGTDNTSYPAYLYRAQGVRWLSNTNGLYSKAFVLQDYCDASYTSAATSCLNFSGPYLSNLIGFAKSHGMGDVEALSALAPIEIGNRVWDDLDGDGVQDAGEPGLSGLQVSLQGPTTTVTVNTDADGLYYFNNLRPYTAYTLTVNVPAGYSLTAANQAALSGASVQSNHAISDTIDSDAALIGSKATIYYSTGSAGQNNHGLDFGFTQPVKGQVDIVNTAPSTVDLMLVKTASITGATPGVAFNYTLTVTNQSTTTTATNVTLSDPLPAGVLYNGATASGGSGGACSYNSGTRTVTCTWATLPPGQQAVATITVTP